jgi:hypothetical protein
VSDVLSELRTACRLVAEQAGSVELIAEAVPAYAAALRLDPRGASAVPPSSGAPVHLLGAAAEATCAYWLTLDAVNFGSGWFPTLRKRDRRSGYHTVAMGITDRFERLGPWSCDELARIDASEIAGVLGQDPGHELMGLFAASLRDLGARISAEHDGRFGAVIETAGSSAVALAELLAHWDCFADVSGYAGLRVPFLKRAQIAAADLAQAGAAPFADLDRLTMFADNLVPHVLRVDGLLRVEPELVGRIERGELIEHGSPEEVEIRACALHAVELIVSARASTCAVAVDRLLWTRGQEPRYKGSPRHRSRCTAY